MANLLLLGTALFIAFLLGYILRCIFCRHRNDIGGFSGKRLWVFLLALLWGLLSLWWYACKIKHMCDESAKVTTPEVVMAPAAVTPEPVPAPAEVAPAPAAAPIVEAPQPAIPARAPIAFAWSSPDSVTTAEFDAIKSRIISELPDGKMLHIVGQYFNGENNPSEFPDLGVARAVDTAKHFVGSVDETRILVSSENLGDYTGKPGAMMPAVKFGYADLPDSAAAPAPATGTEAAAPNSGAEAAEPNTAAVEGAPVTFQWSSSEPQVNADFEAVRSKLISDMGEDQALRITGLYFDDEENDTLLNDMGLSRAAKVRELFIADADKNRVLIASERVQGSGDERGTAFAGVKFALLPVSEAGFKVKEAGDHRVIYFPFDSHQSSVDSNLEIYVADLARELKDGGKSIRIVGHTDNQGNASYNRHLGMMRARMVGDLLAKHGVEQRFIRAESEGEDSPVADNSTETGRAENRRVELFIQ